MASAGPRRGAIIEGINVTPLVDITLVLLIIFMVTAKIAIAPALMLDLPQASQSEVVEPVLSVTLPERGEMLVDGEPADDAALDTKVRAALLRDPNARALIQAERAVAHGRVMSVLDRLRANGLSHVAFATSQPAATAVEAVQP